MNTENNAEPQKKCGFVALIGPTNAGKSTFLNHIIGAKVSIVSHKVQTTRALMRGIAIKDNTQLIFIDTPGIFKPARNLDRAMIATAWQGTKDADIIALMVDAQRGFSDDVKTMIATLKTIHKPCFLLLNKIDLCQPELLLELTQQISQAIEFTQIFMISSQTGSGCNDVLDALIEKMPVSPWHYPEDQISDAPNKLLAAEITREKLYERLHQEIPYSTTVETESWKELKDGSVRIEQVIYTQRQSQKKIILGAKGAAIKWISKQSREELGQIFDCTIHLFLFVKVRQNWMRDPERYTMMGLNIAD